MSWFEQGWPLGQPASAAWGSQSCASFEPLHVTLHSEAAPWLTSKMQQTVPGGQFAAPAHLSPAVSPSFGRGHVAPMKQEYARVLFPRSATQHVSRGIEQTAVPHGSCVRSPPGPASGGFTPPSAVMRTSADEVVDASPRARAASKGAPVASDGALPSAGSGSPVPITLMWQAAASTGATAHAAIAATLDRRRIGLPLESGDT